MNDAAALRMAQRATAIRSGRRRAEWLSAVLAGGAAAAWVATASDGAAASVRWLWAAVALYAVAMLRIPFVLYWRADAGLLTRLPVRGRPLFDAALRSTAALAGQALLAALLAALPLLGFEVAATAGGPADPVLSGQAGLSPLASLSLLSGVELLARHAALAAVLALAVAGLIPAVAIGAGALVVSGKAQQVLASVGPELPAPPTSWLGVLPGLASAVVVLFAVDLMGWLSGGRPELGEAAPLLVGLVAVSGIAAALARRASERVMPAMLRDVSALDRQRLAPLELTPPPATLRVMRRWLSPASARLLDKHALLVSRRYPMTAVLGAVAFATQVITALAAPDALGLLVTTWTMTLAYAWILRGRLQAPPVELPRLLASLPFSPAQVAAARRAYVLWWWGLHALLPAGLVLARTSSPLPLAGVLAAATAVLVVGLRRG